MVETKIRDNCFLRQAPDSVVAKLERIWIVIVIQDSSQVQALESVAVKLGEGALLFP